jgi:magnesium transporter
MPKRRSKTVRLRPSGEHAAATAAHAHPRSWYRDQHGAIRRDLDAKEFAGIVAGGHGTLWVDIDLRSREQQALLEKVFRFHPLSIEDTLSAEGRVKFEEFTDYALAVVRAVRFVSETEDLYDIETFNLWSFLGRNFVVTVHGPHAPGVEATMERLGRNADLLEKGPARLLHQILDSTVDAYFPVLDQLDAFVDGLEERVFVNFEQEALRDIFSVKRLVLQLKRHLGPMREVFNSIQSRPCHLIPPQAQVYFRDVYDHVIRINESLDTYRDLITSTMDSYLMQISNRMNLVTKGLTVVATLSVPFVVVSGMWGMNFAEVPFAHTRGGFWLLLAVQLGLGGGLLLMLKRRGWL